MLPIRFARKLLVTLIFVVAIAYILRSFTITLIAESRSHDFLYPNDQFKIPSNLSVIYVDIPVKMDYLFGQKFFIQPTTNEVTWPLSSYPVKDYFEGLKMFTGICRKLHRVMGEFMCTSETTYTLDGEKVICLDPPLQIGVTKSKTRDCLVLSFGIFDQLDFDVRLRLANCEVHMFDIYEQLNFSAFIGKDKFLHFHEFGLSDKDFDLNSTRPDKLFFRYRTLPTIIEHLNASRRLINILKIDIENHEWNFLFESVKHDYFDIVGQIVIELHTEQSYNFGDLRRVLLLLEAKGFRRTSYQDNVSSGLIIDEEATSHYKAAEVLLVNSNWYNETFRRAYQKLGYNFT